MNVEAGTFVQAKVPDLGNAPIPAKAYYDPEWFELERQAVFLRTWFPVGHVCEVPESGNFIRREIEFARASLLIVRGKDGVVRAFHNACTHRGTQLTDDTCGKQAKFSCRYHMWTFGTDGALLSAPDFERFGLEKGQIVPLSRRVTETNIKSQGLLRQLFGNIGGLSTDKLIQ